MGLDDSQRADARASIICQITAETADGTRKLLAKTPLLATGKLCQWNFELTLPPATVKLHLLVEDAGDGIAADHADWVNAGFLAE